MLFSQKGVVPRRGVRDRQDGRKARERRDRLISTRLLRIDAASILFLGGWGKPIRDATSCCLDWRSLNFIL